MFTLRSVLFARDFSTCSECALQYALEIAQTTGAVLHVLHADVLQEVLAEMPSAPATAGEKAREAMRRVLEKEDLDSPFDPQNVRIEHVLVRDAAPAPAILDYAASHDVDLIVMGTHGRRGMRRLLLGSVAREVVQRAPCPVLTVPRMPSMTTPRFERLLVPVDFSDHAMVALSRAKALAATYGAQIELLHVIEEHLRPAFYTTGIFASIYDACPGIEATSQTFLQRLFKETPGPDVDVAYHVVPGRAEVAIVNQARQLDADAILMSTHGLTGLEHFLLGSVTEKVVNSAPCPVLTIKAYPTRRALQHVADEAIAAI